MFQPLGMHNILKAIVVLANMCVRDAADEPNPLLQINYPPAIHDAHLYFSLI